MPGAASLLAPLATAGIELAKVAVLVVLGSLVAFSAAVFGTVKILQLFGVDVPSFLPGDPRGITFQDDVMDVEYADAMAESSGEAMRSDGWGTGWNTANGTREADLAAWRN